MTITPEEILDFWFTEIGEGGWFAGKPELDEKVRARFAEAHAQAVAGKLRDWENTPTGMLGLSILLDQFSRHLYRGTAKAFEFDDLALDLARTAIIKHFDDRIDVKFKLFFYLPFMHSENLGDQRLALFYIRERTKNPTWLDHAENHFLIIQTFGRFPHRNKALNRTATAAEEEFLKTDPYGQSLLKLHAA